MKGLIALVLACWMAGVASAQAGKAFGDGGLNAWRVPKESRVASGERRESEIEKLVGYGDKAGGIVTNTERGDLSAKAFHLMIVGDDSGTVAARFYRPQSAQLSAFMQGCEIRRFEAGDPFVREHHSDLMRKHAELPIVAMVDRSGGVWWSAGGREIPASEQELASTMAYYYSETMTAKAKAGGGGSGLRPVLNRENYSQPLLNPALNSGGPQPFRPDGGRRPFFNPQVDIDHNVNIPPNLSGSVQGSLDQDTRRLGYFGGAVAIVCAIILGIALVLHGGMLGNAMTDDANDKSAREQVRDLFPGLFANDGGVNGSGQVGGGQ